MTTSRDFLIEIGMEELPPLAMPVLAAAFEAELCEALAGSRLAHGEVERFAAPRRLALLIRDLAERQPDETEALRGPPVRIAFDDEGRPTKAAEAFARKAGTTVDALSRLATDKGEWLYFEAERQGEATGALIEGLIRGALDRLPIPRRMRWGSEEEGFVRPVHWVVALHGDEVLAVSLFGIAASRESRGHRFHHPGPVHIDCPGDYESALRAAKVIARFDERRDAVWSQASGAAAAFGGSLMDDPALVDEITALCDWPVAVLGQFDERFLALPGEVLESTLKKHQRYFPVVDAQGSALNAFVTIANIESRSPGEVRRGNERVVAPRLADAAFFWRNDTRVPLASRRDKLDQVIYQKALGTVGDKVARTEQLLAHICEALGIDSQSPMRAALLSRCDLVTDMVGEFPDLQGIMGGHYARHDGEAEAVARAVREQYFPRFAGDAIPHNLEGRVLAVADRVDSLAGIFAIGKRPSGSRDPFALRRAAVGLVRILIEGEMDLDLVALLQRAVALQPVDTSIHPELADDLYDFVMERLRHYYDSEAGRLSRHDIFEAVLQRTPRSVMDFDQRLRGMAAFVDLAEAEALAASNKRIANILRSAGVDAGASLDATALALPAEVALANQLADVQDAARPMLAARDYAGALSAMAALQPVVDQFFDDVMVMVDDVALRRNRLALLGDVRSLFLEVADISELQAVAGG